MKQYIKLIVKLMKLNQQLILNGLMKLVKNSPQHHESIPRVILILRLILYFNFFCSQIIDRLFSTISTLTLIPSLSLNKKRFTCNVQHRTLTDNTLRIPFEIQITSPPNTPIIQGYSSTKFLINGSYLTLSCQSTGGNPSGKISWYRLENKKSNSSITIYEQNNISLIITPADNNQTYSCQVTNDYLESIGKNLQTNITLKVACKDLIEFEIL